MYFGFRPAASTDGGVSDGHADLSAAMTSALASASDGDTYQTTNGRTYRWHEASKTLWPAAEYARIDDVISGASGAAYGLLSETLAEVMARGGVVATTGGGTVTKTAGGAMVISAPNPSTKTAEFQFDSNGGESSVAALVCVSGVTGTDMASTRLRILTDAEQMRLSLSNGSAGACDFLQTFSAVESHQIGDLDVSSTDDVWILMFLDTSDSKRIAYAMDVEANEMIAVQVDQMLTGGPWTTSLEFQVQNTTGIAAEISVKHFAFVSLS